MTTFQVTVIRLAGTNPLTKKPIERAEETLQIEASSRHEAYQMSLRRTTIQFMGAEREVLIDGTPELGNF